MTCSATVPERLIYSPLIVISYDFGSQELVAEDNPNATQSAISRDDNIFSRIVTIDPVKTSDARTYFCAVSFGDPLFVLVMDNDELEVQSESYNYCTKFYIVPLSVILYCHYY